MSSVYTAQLAQFQRMLGNLQSILRMAQAHASAKKIDPAVLLGMRLYPDMFNLTRQVQIATDQVRNGCARLAGAELLKIDDTEATFEDLYARIDKTVAFLGTLLPAQFEEADARAISFKAGDRDMQFTGADYLTTWIIPNFYFHVSTAYAILRHNGVELGKRNFLAG